MFFSQFWGWLDKTLNGYIASEVTKVAALISPMVVTFACIYVGIWGYFHLKGEVQESVMDAARRIVTIGVLMGLSTGLWFFNGPIVDTFFNGPFALAAGLVGSPPIVMFDNIWRQGAKVAELFWANGSVLDSNVGFYLMAFVVMLITGILCVYGIFLLAIARIALAVILPLAPFFFAALFFDTTKRFFEAWVAQLVNYGVVAILTGSVAALLLSLVDHFAAQTVAYGSSINLLDATDFLLCAVLVFLMLRQVMPMAAGLASGVALTTHSAFGSAMAWGLGTTRNAGRGAWDALTGQGTSRWDPVSRKAGYWPTRAAMEGTRKTTKAIWRVARGNNTLSRKQT